MPANVAMLLNTLLHSRKLVDWNFASKAQYWLFEIFESLFSFSFFFPLWYYRHVGRNSVFAVTNKPKIQFNGLLCLLQSQSFVIQQHFLCDLLKTRNEIAYNFIAKISETKYILVCIV